MRTSTRLIIEILNAFKCWTQGQSNRSAYRCLSGKVPTTDAAERWGPRIALGGPGPSHVQCFVFGDGFLIQIKSNAQYRLEPGVPLAGPREADGKYAPCRILRQRHDRNSIRDVYRGYDAGSAWGSNCLECCSVITRPKSSILCLRSQLFTYFGSIVVMRGKGLVRRGKCIASSL